MARTFEPTEEEIQGWNTWVESQPENVRKVAEKFAPWELYRLKDTGHRVKIYSLDTNKYDGSVKLTVLVLGEYNWVKFERQVFGISPEDLEPCELPGEDEKVGVELTLEERDHYIKKMKDRHDLIDRIYLYKKSLN